MAKGAVKWKNQESDKRGQKRPKEESFQYFAFISYKRTNSRIANWLHKKLNWYRFPKRFVDPVNRPPHPMYIRPVLRDKNNLEVNRDSFWTSIKKQLDQARFLIVLCSPESATSPHVNDEIEYFLNNKIRKNAIDHILPVIINGNPGKGDESECLPLALQRADILKRNLPTMTPDEGEKESIAQEQCLTRIVSFLLRVNHEKIKDEYRLAQQLQTRIKLALASVAVVVLTIIAGWAVFERNLKEVARQEAVEKKEEAQKALAKADFQEASRLLDKGDTSLGLAHLGSALKDIHFPPAIERANGLILNRSWLIKTATYKSETNSSTSPDLNYILSTEKSDEKPTVLHLQAPFSSSNPLKLTLPSKPIQNLAFTGDGMGFAALSSVDEEQQYHLWQLSDSAKITNFTIPPGSQPISTSLSGKLIAFHTSPQAIKIFDAISGNCLSELTKIPGYTVSSLEFDSDDSIAAVAQVTSSENQTSYLQSISPENRPKYTIECVGLKNEKKLLNIDGTAQP